MRAGANFLRTVNARLILFSVLWTLMSSAMLVESDVYRYVTIAFVVFSLVSHRNEIKKISSDWLAILCYAWALYAVIRFSFGVVFFGERGTSEWLYIFPVFFPFVGVALSATRRYIFSAATLLVACGLIGLLFTLDLRTLLTGERAAPLLHHNPIHAGIGSCMLFLTAIFWMLYTAETGRLSGWLKWPILALGITTAILSLVGALGAQSKGAWLALVATIAFVAVLSLLRCAGKWRLYLLGGVLLIASVGVIVASSYVEKVAGSTMDAAANLASNAVATGNPLAAMQEAIADPATPRSTAQRLRLWSNAIELIQAAPWVGWGNEWLLRWRNTAYSDVGFDLIHNGYLEILVRHGLLGISFLLIFTIAAASRINNAYRCDVISSSVALYLYSMGFFFFCTIATNSNNRLALGESFFIIAAAAVFAVTLIDREAKG